MVNRALANAGPSLSQHAKSVQKELALADAREKEAKKSKETIAANTKRVSVHLLKSLASQLDRFGASAEGGPGPGAGRSIFTFQPKFSVCRRLSSADGGAVPKLFSLVDGPENGPDYPRTVQYC